MRFALNNDSERIEVMFSGERAKCECCLLEGVGNYGSREKILDVFIKRL